MPVLNMAMLEAWYTNMVKMKNAFAGTTPPDPIPLPSVTTIDGLLEGIVGEADGSLVEAAKSRGKYHTVDDAYILQLPNKLYRWYGIKKLGGKTVAWNQQVNAGTSSVALANGHKYYTIINGTGSIVTGDGSSVSISNDAADMVIDISRIFGIGKEPTTVDDFKTVFPTTHYSFDSGTLLSAAVTDVVSKDGETVLQTYSVPAEVKALTGYGWSAGSAYNYIDFDRKVFVQMVARADLGDTTWGYYSTAGKQRFYGNLPEDAKMGFAADDMANIVCPIYVTNTATNVTNHVIDKGISVHKSASRARMTVWDSGAGSDAAAFGAAMSGVYAYYELATPVETDISAYLTDDVITDVVSGGSIEFKNVNGDDYKIPVFSQAEYIGV